MPSPFWGEIRRCPLRSAIVPKKRQTARIHRIESQRPYVTQWNRQLGDNVVNHCGLSYPMCSPHEPGLLFPTTRSFQGAGYHGCFQKSPSLRGSHARMSANADSRPVNASNPHSRPSNASTWQLCHYRCHVGNRQLATTRRAASLF